VILENAFVVAAPMEDVFDALTDAGRVVPCLPGARLGTRVDDLTVKAELRLTLGRTTIPYRGTLRIDSCDRQAGALALRLDAREGRGQGTAQGTVNVRLRESRGSTTVSMHSEVELHGRAEKAAAEIEGTVQQLLSEFGENLERRLRGHDHGTDAPQGPAPTADSGQPVEGVASHLEVTAPAVAVRSALAGTDEPGAGAEPEPPRIPGTVRVMTSEPVPAADVAPREGLLASAAEELRRRPWLAAIPLAALLLVLLGLRRRR